MIELKVWRTTDAVSGVLRVWNTNARDKSRVLARVRFTAVTHREEAVGARMGQFGAVARVWGGVAPACVASYHEGFKARDCGGNDNVVFVDLGPYACQDSIKGGVGGGEFDIEVVETENEECDGSIGGSLLVDW